MPFYGWDWQELSSSTVELQFVIKILSFQTYPMKTCRIFFLVLMFLKKSPLFGFGDDSQLWLATIRGRSPVSAIPWQNMFESTSSTTRRFIFTATLSFSWVFKIWRSLKLEIVGTPKTRSAVANYINGCFGLKTWGLRPTKGSAWAKTGAFLRSTLLPSWKWFMLWPGTSESHTFIEHISTYITILVIKNQS